MYTCRFAVADYEAQTKSKYPGAPIEATLNVGDFSIQKQTASRDEYSWKQLNYPQADIGGCQVTLLKSPSAKKTGVLG